MYVDFGWQKILTLIITCQTRVECTWSQIIHRLSQSTPNPKPLKGNKIKQKFVFTNKISSCEKVDHSVKS